MRAKRKGHITIDDIVSVNWRDTPGTLLDSRSTPTAVLYYIYIFREVFIYYYVLLLLLLWLCMRSPRKMQLLMERGVCWPRLWSDIEGFSSNST